MDHRTLHRIDSVILLWFLFPEPWFHYVAHDGLELLSLLPFCPHPHGIMPEGVSSGVAVAYQKTLTEVSTNVLLLLSANMEFCTCFEDITEDRKNFRI